MFIGFGIMYYVIGISSLAGFLMLFIMFSTNYIVGKVQMGNIKNLMNNKDLRIKKTNEIFSMMKLVKANA